MCLVVNVMKNKLKLNLVTTVAKVIALTAMSSILSVITSHRQSHAVEFQFSQSFDTSYSGERPGYTVLPNVEYKSGDGYTYARYGSGLLSGVFSAEDKNSDGVITTNELTDFSASVNVQTVDLDGHNVSINQAWPLFETIVNYYPVFDSITHQVTYQQVTTYNLKVKNFAYQLGSGFLQSFSVDAGIFAPTLDVSPSNSILGTNVTKLRFERSNRQSYDIFQPGLPIVQEIHSQTVPEPQMSALSVSMLAAMGMWFSQKKKVKCSII